MRIVLWNPWFLSLLAAVPVVLWFLARGTPPTVRSRLIWSLRLLALALVILALARPRLHLHQVGARRIVAVDVSQSLAPAQRSRLVDYLQKISANGDGVRNEYLLFDARVRDLKSAPSAQQLLRVPSRAGSDLSAALVHVLASLRGDRGARLLLISDGGGIDRRSLEVAGRLAAEGVAVDALALPAGVGLDAAVEAIEVPQVVRRGSTVRVIARGEAIGIERARVGLWRIEERNGVEIRREVGSREVAVAGGVLRAGFDLPVGGAEQILLEAAVEAPGDRVPANDAVRQLLSVEPRTRIALVRPAERSGPELVEFLELREFAVSSHDEGTLEDLLAGLGQIDLMVLENLPADRWPGGALERLAEWVRGGGSLLMCGREGVFGTGGYSSGALEPLLPVRFERIEQRRDPSVALVIIIDTSGSMMGERIQLAKEIARAAIKKLRPHDKAGIVEFHGAKRWAAPIQPAANAIDLERALNRLQAGGGTVIFPALEEAYFNLQNVTTRYKHILVLTDGGVESGPFEGLLRRMAQRGMTVSTVGVGARGHSKFLLNLAHWGRGRYYSAPSRFYLPEVRLKQPSRSSLPPFVEGRFALQRVGAAEFLHGIDLEEAPPLLGYVEGRAKEQARTLLETSGGHAIYVRWRAGRGKVGVYLSELLGPWAAQMASWSEYGQLWSQLLSDLAPLQGPAGMELEVVADRRGVDLRLSGVAGAFDPGEVRVAGGALRVPRWTRRGGEGASARVLFGGAGALRIIHSPTGRAVTVWPEVPDERPRVRIAERLRTLVHQGGGSLVSDPGDLPVVPAIEREQVHETFSFLLAAALAVYLLEILLRRL